jgi:hypothetical protein
MRQGGRLPPNLDRLLRRALVCAAVLAAAAPATASAGTLSDTLKKVTTAITPTACEPDADVRQVFAPWGDRAMYRLAPGGDFEPAAQDWTLSGRARVVAGNADQHVGGAGDAWSLELPAGASATSPATCVGLAEPAFRMFSSGALTGAVLVQAVYSGIPVPAGVATGGRWSPSLPMLTGVGLLGRTFSIRVTNIGLGTVRVDDVYVDPYRRG